MRSTLIIFRRELASYFATPAGLHLHRHLSRHGGRLRLSSSAIFFDRGQADLQPFFSFHPWLYLVLIPALSMRLWAEERKSGTIELFLTLPISMTEAVPRQVSRRLGLCRNSPPAYLPILDHGQYLGPSRQRRDPRELYRQLPDGGRLSCDRRPRSRP